MNVKDLFRRLNEVFVIVFESYSSMIYIIDMYIIGPFLHLVYMRKQSLNLVPKEISIFGDFIEQLGFNQRQFWNLETNLKEKIK